MAAKSADRPRIVVIAGPNGAGKTTFASHILPKYAKCPEFLNADLIAAGLSPFAPESQSLLAGKLLLERFRKLMDKRASFGVETTLSGRTYVNLLGSARDAGYEIHLFFLWLPTADMAIQRVRNRIQEGGHSVPEDDIRRRHALGVRNLFSLYRDLSDVIYWYDASKLPPPLVARESGGRLRIHDRVTFARMREGE